MKLGVEGGFTQAGHGKRSGIARLRQGDSLVFYSPKERVGSGPAVQAFTALGIVADDTPYQVEMKPDFHPWRRNVHFKNVRAAPIAPMKKGLSFVREGPHWGLAFRRGLFQIPEPDFAIIAGALTHSLLV